MIELNFRSIAYFAFTFLVIISVVHELFKVKNRKGISYILLLLNIGLLAVNFLVKKLFVNSDSNSIKNISDTTFPFLIILLLSIEIYDLIFTNSLNIKKIYRIVIAIYLIVIILFIIYVKYIY